MANTTAHDPPGTAAAAVNRAVRITVLTMTGLMVVGGLAMLMSDFESFPQVQAGGILISGLLFAIAIAVRRMNLAVWLSLGALITQVVTIASTQSDSDARTSASTAIFLITYFAVLVLPRVAALVAIVALAALWAAIVPANPMLVEVSGRIVNARWLTLPQLVVSGCWVWATWYPEMAKTRLSDAADLAAQRSLTASRAAQERLRVWRESVVRVHETVLNDIRYVLGSESIDGARLGAQVDSSRSTQAPMHDGREVVADIVAEAAAAAPMLEVVLEEGPWSPFLAAGPAAALRTLLVEVFRNAARHSGAVTATVAAWVEVDDLHIEVRHDGSDLDVRGAPGIGQQVTLLDTARGVGGSIELTPHGAHLRVPLAVSAAESAPLPPLDTGRITLATATAANAVGGTAFAVVLASVGGRSAAAAGCAILTAAVAATVARRRRVVSTLTVVAAASLAMAGAGLLAMPQSCAIVGVSANVVVLTEFGLAAILMWVQNMRQALLGLVGIGVLLAVHWSMGVACPKEVGPSVIAELAAPVMIAVVLVSVRFAVARSSRQRQIAASRTLEAAIAEAAQDAALRLHDSVADATQLMMRIAARSAASEADRRRLRQLDGVIRASIQVDPKTAGGFATSAYNLTRLAAEHGQSVRVLTIKDSGDMRPLPEEVTRAAQSLLLAAPEGSATIQALSAPGEDTLLVTVPGDTVERAGLPSRWQVSVAGCSAELEAEQSNAIAVLIARRGTDGVISE